MHLAKVFKDHLKSLDYICIQRKLFKKKRLLADQTTQSHAHYGFNPGMDRPPVARIDYPAAW